MRELCKGRSVISSFIEIGGNINDAKVIALSDVQHETPGGSELRPYVRRRLPRLGKTSSELPPTLGTIDDVLELGPGAELSDDSGSAA